jgi:hypothetical protein
MFAILAILFIILLIWTGNVLGAIAAYLVAGLLILTGSPWLWGAALLCLAIYLGAL